MVFWLVRCKVPFAARLKGLFTVYAHSGLPHIIVGKESAANIWSQTSDLVAK